MFDGILWIMDGRCRVDRGPETVKQEGITNFEDDIHYGSMDRKSFVTKTGSIAMEIWLQKGGLRDGGKRAREGW